MPNFQEPINKFREQTAGFILAALSLVAGLAWNDAIQTLINELFPLHKNSVLVKFIYAVFVTLVVIFISTFFIKILRKDDPNK